MKKLLFVTLIFLTVNQQIYAMQNQRQNQRSTCSKCALVTLGILKTTVGFPLATVGSFAVVTSGLSSIASAGFFANHLYNQGPTVDTKHLLAFSDATLKLAIMTGGFGTVCFLVGSKLCNSGCNDIKKACAK